MNSHRKTVLPWALRSIAGCCAFFFIAIRTIEAAPPNIIFILTDDHRWDMMSTANAIIKTPNLTSLSQGGINFTNAFVTTPICAGSRASILTGLHEWSHCYNFGTPNAAMQYAWTAYPKILKDNGYVTGFIGKYGAELVNPAFRDSMFNLYDDLGRWQAPHPYFMLYKGDMMHLTDVETDKALDFIRANSAKQFCLQLNYHAPHADDGEAQQYFWPKAFDNFYVRDVIPSARISDNTTFNELPLFLRTCEAHNRWTWRFNTPDKYQTMMKGYFRMISNIDSCIGLIRHTLDSLGIAGNTVVILTGDNGYFLGERQMADKFLGWEEALHVPLLIYDPRPTARHGITSANAVLNIDITPTILELAGLKIPPHYQGKSLCPFVNGTVPAPAWRDEFCFELRTTAGGVLDPMFGVRTPQWKYVIFDQQRLDNEQLYDLKNDPGEITNLVKNPQYATSLAQMRQKALRYRDSLACWPVNGYYYMDQFESGNEYNSFKVDSNLVYSGAWTRQVSTGDYNGTAIVANSAGEYAQYTFSGKSMIKIGVRKGPSCGICKVYLDGAPVLNNYDTWSAASAYRQVIFADSSLTPGPHVVKLEATGQKRAAATGTNVMFDFFLVKQFGHTGSAKKPAPVAQRGIGIGSRGASPEIVICRAGTGTVSVKLFSLQGRLIMDRAVRLQGDETRVKVGAGQPLRPGFYLCQVSGRSFGSVVEEVVATE